MSRLLQVTGNEIFRITVPDDAKVYIGPLVPEKEQVFPEGTKIQNYYAQRDYDSRAEKSYALHVEDSQGTKLAMIPNVKGFRDISVDYTEKIVSEQGTTIWKSDSAGYKREESVNRTQQWQRDNVEVLPAPTKPTRSKRK